MYVPVKSAVFQNSQIKTYSQIYMTMYVCHVCRKFIVLIIFILYLFITSFHLHKLSTQTPNIFRDMNFSADF